MLLTKPFTFLKPSMKSFLSRLCFRKLPMAKSRFQPLEDPPISSSSNDEANNVVVIPSESETETVVVTKPSSSRRGKKRARVETTATTTKKKVKRDKTDGKKTKKFSSQILMEEDEIVILQGVIDYRLDKGKSFNEDYQGFYDFVKRSLNNDFSPYQLVEKLDSLKIKYVEKWNKSAAGPTFPAAQDRQCFGLANVIWGSMGIASDEYVGAVSMFGVSEDLVRQRWSMMAVDAKKRAEEEWRVLRAKNIEIMLEMASFLYETTSSMAALSTP